MQNILSSAYFIGLIKFIFFRCFSESSCFRLITFYPHEKQVNSFSYGNNVIRLQCKQCLACFSIISSSDSSIYYQCFY